MKIITIVKTIILISFVIAYNTIIQFVSPIVANELAMNQMQNNINSSLGIQIYTYITNYDWVLLIAIILILYCKEIVNIFVNKEKYNEEV